MATKKSIAAVFIAATIAATLFTPFQGIVTSSSGIQEVNNTSFAADIGEPVELEGYDVDQSTLEVYWYNSTSSSYEQVDSSYWNFSYDTAEITVSNGTKISQGDDMQAWYEYQATSGETTTVVRLTPLFLALLILGVLGNEIQKRS